VRKYGQVSPLFWTGKTGRRIRDQGDAAIVVALYLMTCPSSSMTGLYYLPTVTLAHETGRDTEGACEALRRLNGLDFCSYDFESELVFVHTMALWQIAKTLKPTDKRIKGIITALDPYSSSDFYDDFWRRYAGPFCLDPALAARPIRGASKPHARGIHQEQEQEQDPEQEQEQEREQEQEGARDVARELADRIWQEQELRRYELKSEGIGEHTPGLSLADGAGKLELIHRIGEALTAGETLEVAEARCRHVLDVLIAEARDQGSLRWLDGGHWKAERFSTACSLEVGETIGRKGGSGAPTVADIMSVKV